jgi:hypothetical protein
MPLPLKLRIGLCKKIGQPNYGSRGANINLEVEVDAALLSDPTRLREHIRGPYGIVRASIAEELNAGDGTHGNNHANGHADHGAEGAGNGDGNGNGAPKSNGGTQPRPATQSQVKALFAICKNRGMNLNAVLRDRFRCGKPEQLSIREASQLIDELKSNPAPFSASPGDHQADGATLAVVAAQQIQTKPTLSSMQAMLGHAGLLFDRLRALAGLPFG